MKNAFFNIMMKIKLKRDLMLCYDSVSGYTEVARVNFSTETQPLC